MLDHTGQLAWVSDYIRKLQQQKAFGEVTVVMQGGNIVLIAKRETEKPPEAYRAPNTWPDGQEDQEAPASP